jgi:hypothetical protein
MQKRWFKPPFLGKMADSFVFGFRQDNISGSLRKMLGKQIILAPLIKHRRAGNGKIMGGFMAGIGIDGDAMGAGC